MHSKLADLTIITVLHRRVYPWSFWYQICGAGVGTHRIICAGRAWVELSAG